VALTSNGKTYYKLVEELEEGDMAARVAADRLREAWLKERQDGWPDYGGGPRGEGRGRPPVANYIPQLLYTLKNTLSSFTLSREI
jgi:hypothetical protein